MNWGKTFGWMSSIRSWIALLISGTFCYGVIAGKIDATFTKEIIMMVMIFYFLKDRPTPAEKLEGEREERLEKKTLSPPTK